jgi:ARID/BRIGHT DNA binding domain
MGPSPVPQNNAGPQVNGQPQQNWMAGAQQGGSQSLPFANQQISQNQHFQPGPGSQTNVLNTTQMSLQPSQPPPHSIPTPQQAASGQGAMNQIPSNSGNQFSLPTPQHNAAGPNAVPPLDRTRFHGSYKHFCQTKKLSLDDRVMTIQNRMLDLHALHVEVMNAGGSQQVSHLAFFRFAAPDTVYRL